MMTISESQYSSNKRSSIHKINDKIVHQDNFNDVQQSNSVNSSLITKRGFKPSDMFDPQKKEFLTNLSYKLFPNDGPLSRDVSPSERLRSGSEELENKSSILVGEKEVDLNKIFTPAPDAEEHLIKKNKKAFASSAFYVPGVHPTVREQVELARAISRSLSDSSNQLSRGQSMYVNRKKRSVKWVHEGKGRNTSNSCATPTPSANHDTAYRPPSSRARSPAPPPARPGRYGTYPKPALKSAMLAPPLPPSRLNDVHAAPPSPRLPSRAGRSFNTAPRGWGQLQDYYRPVTFDDDARAYSPYSPHSLQTPSPAYLPYTDY